MMRRVRPRLVASLFVAFGIAGVATPAWSQCVPSIPMDEFVYRFGIAGNVHSDSDLLALLENPTILTVEAVPAGDDDSAATVVTTETHALYPVDALAIVNALKDAETLVGIIPDLAIHETLCTSGPDMRKELQRTEFHVLFFTFGTEYLIDVHYALNGPEEYGSYWGMYESLDGKLAYQYGSWYFRNLSIHGRRYTYVRHFIRTGVNSRVPGLRMIIRSNAGKRVTEMIDAVYREAVKRYGNTPVATIRHRRCPRSM